MDEAALILDGLSPANIEGSLQAALNLAIQSTQSNQIFITAQHLQDGMQIVLG